MPVAHHQNTAIHYQVLPGNGPPLLLIRGLARDRRFWLGLDRLLIRSFTVIVFDNRGVGKSGHPVGRWTVADMADDAAEVIEAAGFDKAHVFGLSLGGMIAQELALRHPSKVDRLVLGCSGPGSSEGTLPSPKAILSLLLAIVLPARSANKTLARLTLSPAYRNNHPETIPTWLELMQAQGVSRWAVLKQLDAARRHRTADRLHAIASPTLVLSGDADRLITPENSGYLARHIPGAELQWLSGVGHDFPTEQPEQTAQAIERHCLAAN